MSAWFKPSVLTGGALLAGALPTWVVSTIPPSATFFNQAIALVGWGLWASVLGLTVSHPSRASHVFSRDLGWVVLWGQMGIFMVAISWSAWHTALPLSLMTTAWCMLGAVAVTLMLGYQVGKTARATEAFAALCLAMVLGALVNTGVALVQAFGPGWTDGVWIASTSAAIAGRASGNVRQPNHLSSLLLWGLAALAWLATTARRLEGASGTRPTGWREATLFGSGLLLCTGLVLSGSRTGTLGVLLLTSWGALDRRLAWAVRRSVLALAVAYPLLWWGWSRWLLMHAANAEVDGRFNLQGDISASRFGIWSNAWDLVLQHPWTGVGWGSFNFAWSLTPFPHRPTAFFDNAHNLPLHLAVELGLPAAMVVCGLLGYALWRALRAGWRAPGIEGPLGTTAGVMVLVMALHSLLEYPLWYAYFLLPTGFLWGLCLGLPSPSPSQSTDTASGGSIASAPLSPKTHPLRRSLLVLVVAGAALMAGTALAILDYERVVAIFAPADGAAPLKQRIEDGKRSVFFNHHAYYAEANDPHTPPEAVLSAINIAGHNLLDTRLMTSWAKAYAATGDLERARHLAQRLREFGHSKDFFAVCDAPPVPNQPLPFQCTPPTHDLKFEDFLPR